MKIKEEDSQHLVIVSTFGERFVVGVFYIGIPSSVLAALVSVGNIPTKETISLIFLVIVVTLIGIYFGVRRFLGKRIVLEKTTNSVILEAPSLLLVRQKRIIPFAEVNSVEITYKPMVTGDGSSRPGYQVSLDTGGQMVKIDHTTNEDLAYKIKMFIGK